MGFGGRGLRGLELGFESERTTLKRAPSSQDLALAGVDCRGGQQAVVFFPQGDHFSMPRLSALLALCRCLLLLSAHSIRIYSFNARRALWEDIGVKDVANLYTITSLCWRADGSKSACALPPPTLAYPRSIRQTQAHARNNDMQSNMRSGWGVTV